MVLGVSIDPSRRSSTIFTSFRSNQKLRNAANHIATFRKNTAITTRPIDETIVFSIHAHNLTIMVPCDT